MAFNFLSDFVRDVRAARRTANDIERLMHMSNGELAQLGLERTQISSYAFKKHFNQG